MMCNNSRWKRPFVAVLGGAGDGNKMQYIDGLLEQVDALVIGGGLANTFLKARGGNIGRSLWNPDRLTLAARLLEKAESRGVKVYLPLDVRSANAIAPGQKPSLEGSMGMFDDKISMDIGPRTAVYYQNVIMRAGTVLWSGIMGIAEYPEFAEGTRQVAEAIAQSGADVIVCGEGSAEAAEKFNISDRVTCVDLHDDSVCSYLSGQFR